MKKPLPFQAHKAERIFDVFQYMDTTTVTDDMVWITNSPPRARKRPDELVFSLPKASEIHTVDELMAMDMLGIYESKGRPKRTYLDIK